MPPQKQTDAAVFISYSHHDKRFLKELLVHLTRLMREESVAVWADTMLEAGDEWRKEIQQALASARVAIILVSAYFLASKFIAEHELPPLLAAAKNEGLTIIPVIAGRCDFEDSAIAELQTINGLNRPLNKLKPSQREDVWEDVVRRVKLALGSQAHYDDEIIEQDTANENQPLRSPIHEAHYLNLHASFSDAVAVLEPMIDSDTHDFVAWFEYAYALTALYRRKAYGAFARAFNESDLRRHSLGYNDAIFEPGVRRSMFAVVGPAVWPHNLGIVPVATFFLSESGRRVTFPSDSGATDIADAKVVRAPGFDDERWIGLAISEFFASVDE